METQKTHGAKLTRTNSSLLRSPTIRSSVHSLSTLNESNPDEKKSQKPYRRPLPSRPLLPIFLSLPFLLVLFFFLFHYLRDDTPILGNLFLACAAIAVASVVGRRWRVLRSGCRGFQRSDSVQWFIGDDRERGVSRNSKKIVREGVEFYSNGDFYEGEFHKGRCNGSGVYNFFVKGRYEGDWVDGKYDGYGMESWAKGSRYRGQYQQGLRHGYGVYRFYSGDTYAGEWVSGQSHGIGAQTCSDGSSYVGEFKCGVKHGLGYYHFRFLLTFDCVL